MPRPEPGRCPQDANQVTQFFKRLAARGPKLLGRRDNAQARIRFAMPQGLATADLPIGAVLEHGFVTMQSSAPTQELHDLTGWALRRNLDLDQLTVDRPSLEDIYLRLTATAPFADSTGAHSTDVHNTERSTR